jgi:hypothetical protein
MTCGTSAPAASRCALAIVLLLMTFSAKAAVFNENDTSRMTDIDAAIASLEKEVGRSIHGLPLDDAEQIEAYSYVELNLEAAHERLNGIFLLVAVSMYMESSSDQLQVLSLMHGQILLQSKTYLNEKKNAIASMATSHPANEAFATYSTRASAILADRAIPLLDELYRRIGALRR